MFGLILEHVECFHFIRGHFDVDTHVVVLF